MSILADMIRAAEIHMDRQWRDEFCTGWEAKDQIEGLKDDIIKRELADLELAHRKLCVEQDIRALKHELEWRVEKRKWDEEQAAAAAKAKAIKEAANVVPLNGSGHPLQ